MTAQARLFYARRRRRSILDPGLGLFKTHDLGFSGDVQVGLRFPDRFRPVTFRTRIRRTGASPRGTVFELGGAVTDLIVYVDGTDLQVAAGASSGDDGLLVTAANFLPPEGTDALVTVAVLPNAGFVWLFKDNRTVASGRTVSGRMSQGWGSTSLGSVGTIVGGANTRVDTGGFEVLQDVEIVEPVSVYMGQIPRHLVVGEDVISTTPLVPQGPDTDKRGSFSQDSYTESFSGGGG